MRPQTKFKSESLNHGDTPATPIATSTLVTETVRSRASSVDTSAKTGAQQASSIDLTEAGSSPDQNITPTVPFYSGRRFSCKELLANGTKCTGSFHRRSDLTKHCNNYHQKPASTQAQTGTRIQSTSEPKPAGSSSEEFAVNLQSTPDRPNRSSNRPKRTPNKPKIATEPKGSVRMKRKAEESLQSKVPDSLQAMAGADPAIAAEGFHGAMLGAQNHPNNGYHPDPSPYTGRGQQMSGFEAQSSLATEGPQKVEQTAHLMPSHDAQVQAPFTQQPSFTQQPWVDPYGPPIAADNSGQLRGPNNEFHGPMGCTGPTTWAQNNQYCHQPHGPQYAAKVRGQVVPLSTFGPSNIGFANDGHAQYQTPVLHEQLHQQQQDNLVNGGAGYNGYTHYQTPMAPPPPSQQQQGSLVNGGAGYNCYTQYQTPIAPPPPPSQQQQPQQKKGLGNDGPGALGYQHTQDWAQTPPQESAVDGDPHEFGKHGFIPEYDHFEAGCLECKGSYCSSCRARFLEWFPNSDFRQFVEEVCNSESVEYYPPLG